MPPRPVLLIAGGSRGIGAATAKLAGASGYDVGVNFKDNAKAAEEVVDAIRKSGGKAVAIQGDMSVEKDVTRVFEAVDAELGRLTHFVYNTGVPGPLGRVEAMQTQWLRDVIDINVVGAFLAVRAAIPRLSTKHGGKGGPIVLMSSVAATLGAPNVYVWYAASKGAIDTMVKGLSLELVDEGIRVNGIQPGSIDTGVNPPERVAKMLHTVPMKRVGMPKELAEGALFLLSDAASYITGATLRISGGR